MERAVAGLLLALVAAGCQPTDLRSDGAALDRAAAYGAAAGGLPTEITARLEQLLWDQRAPGYVRDPLWHQVRSSYDRRQYQPYWIGVGAADRAVQLVKAVCSAESEGLRSNAYQVVHLSGELAELEEGVTAEGLARLDLLLTGAALAYGEDLLAGRIAPTSVAPEWKATAPPGAADSVLPLLLDPTVPLDSAFARLRPRVPAYAALRRALGALRAIDSTGGWPEVPHDQTLRRGMRGAEVDVLRRRLVASGDLAARDSIPGRPFDAALAGAVSRFQARHGLGADGVAGASTLAALNVPVALRIAQVEANLERYRWIPGALLPRYALGQLPDSSIEVIVQGRAVATVDARAGDTLRAVLPPVLADTIAGVTFGGGTAAFTLAQSPALTLRGAEPGTTEDPRAVLVGEALVLASFATGRDTAALRALAQAPDTTRLPAALPFYLFDPTVRVGPAGTVEFDAEIEGRDVAVANALGPARVRTAETCSELASGVAAAAALRR